MPFWTRSRPLSAGAAAAVMSAMSLRPTSSRSSLYRARLEGKCW